MVNYAFGECLVLVLSLFIGRYATVLTSLNPILFTFFEVGGQKLIDAEHRNRNRNLQTSKAPLKSQAQGTSLFTSADVLA